ncbi:hypothetical protein HDU86_004343 [Geranomyces michiganensis]|nr:hypothetical protein HDU86_004343 [Geranomyces michiganensis]
MMRSSSSSSLHHHHHHHQHHHHQQQHHQQYQQHPYPPPPPPHAAAAAWPASSSSSSSSAQQQQHIRQLAASSDYAFPYEKRRDSGVSLPLPKPPLPPQAAAAAAAASKIDSISKSVLTTPRITPSLTLFISAFVHSTWHNTTLPPSPTFTNYTAHILSTTALPFSVLLLSLLLVSRLKKRHPDLRGAEGSECRLLVCALIVAMKVLLDNTYTNKTWEKVCGIPVKELNIMEMEFLAQLDFDTHVSEGEYFAWLQHIELAVQSFKSGSSSSKSPSSVVVHEPIAYSPPPPQQQQQQHYAMAQLPPPPRLPPPPHAYA